MHLFCMEWGFEPRTGILKKQHEEHWTRSQRPSILILTLAFTTLLTTAANR